MQLDTRVNPKDYEEKIYKEWLDKGLFTADPASNKPPYAIVIPPPNVTGTLHIGHALNNTLQDILIRFYRLKGYETLWIPGTDHAGIATQNVVEKKLKEKGRSRFDIGRERFIEEVWKWKKESGGAIIDQLKKLGSSCDWSRERFTMDETLSKAVRKVFVTLYNEGLIYRANYMVNWCVRCRTALSDLEVEYADRNGFLYYMRYPITDGSGVLEIATTRPETYLADSAVAVNPLDGRYRHLIGKTVTLPVINREIPVIADEYVDKEFGSGCLKVTPGSDPNDFEIGRRHKLPEFSCMDENGIITVSPFEGKDRETARALIVEEFKKLGFMGEIKPLVHSVGHCYRCGTVIEPRISMQWFVKVAPLAEQAIAAVERGDIRIIPKQWQANYFEWMRNIRDWCVSRQIWWGHRIPAWHCKKCGHITVSEEEAKSCGKCGSSDLEQETDVLDTWFSSALWPFSTQGWPGEGDTLEKFYPTSVLVTAFDILFFWVARMIMMGLKFMGKAPFREVYIHALVRDEQGQKMSKTKGNVVDPLSMINVYGADALRFALTAFAAQGRDIRISPERIEGYRNFINKIWNASRFILMNAGKDHSIFYKIEAEELEDEDRWILTKLSVVILAVEKRITAYEFNEAALALYDFFWQHFCGWYLEIAKERIFKGEGATRAQALATACYVLEKSMAALHPFIPFVTEHIWQIVTGGDSVLKAGWPAAVHNYKKSMQDLDKVIEIVGAVRNIRGEKNVNPGKLLHVYILTSSEELKKLINAKERIIRTQGKVFRLTLADTPPENASSVVFADYAVYIPLVGMVDMEEERRKLKKDLAELEKDYALYSGKLANKSYLEKASPQVVEKDRAKAAELLNKMENIKNAFEGLAEE